MTALRASEVVQEARSWLGTPYVHQGRQKGAGVDCVGLMIGIARELRLYPSEALDALPTDYAKRPDGKMMRALLARYMTRVWPPEPGDWLHLAQIGQLPTHVGLVATERSMIHAFSEAGEVVEDPLRPAHVRVSKGAYRYRGVVDG